MLTDDQIFDRVQQLVHECPMHTDPRLITIEEQNCTFGKLTEIYTKLPCAEERDKLTKIINEVGRGELSYRLYTFPARLAAEQKVPAVVCKPPGPVPLAPPLPSVTPSTMEAVKPKREWLVPVLIGAGVLAVFAIALKTRGASPNVRRRRR